MYRYKIRQEKEALRFDALGNVIGIWWDCQW